MRTQSNKYYKKIMEYVPENRKVLDLGCGCGAPFAGKYFKLLVGVDIFRKRFSMPEYDLVLYHDIRDLEMFQTNSFDVVTIIDVIEHLEKEEGIRLLKEVERIAMEKIIIFTPEKWDNNKSNTENPACWSYGNKYNLHKSLWTRREFYKNGYTIYECQEGQILAIKEL